MRRLVLALVALACSVQINARLVYPFQYQGEMPSMVRMIDDPRQVGTEDEIIIPPRYTARNGILKTHDFYPQDDVPAVANRGVGGFLPPPVQAPFRSPVPAQLDTVPIYTQNSGLIYPDYSLLGRSQCISVGPHKSEAMNQWCTLNCYHVPSFCPPSHCTCNGDLIKKKKK